MLGSAELWAGGKLSTWRFSTSLETAPHNAYMATRMPEPPDAVVLGCAHFPLLRDELLQVLPERDAVDGFRRGDGASYSWLLEHEAPDAKSADSNDPLYCMAARELNEVLPVLQRYGEAAPETAGLMAFLGKYPSARYFKFPLVRQK